MIKELIPYGETALLINFEQKIAPVIHQQVMLLCAAIKSQSWEGVVSLIPSYASLTVKFNPEKISFFTLKSQIEALDLQESSDVISAPKIVKIPVCYEDEFALDMEVVQQYTKLSKEEIVNLHTANTYRVYMLGFTPGFPYLGGLSERLYVPRKDTPRLQIPAGSVGLAGNQTGVYPQETPGGWQIIGKSPFNFFSPQGDFPIAPGDFIQFYPISKAKFHVYKTRIS